jgi:hypothetical protein
MRGTATDIVTKAGFTDSQFAATPGIPGRILSEKDCAAEGDTAAPNPTAYRSRIGKALWAARGALPIAMYYVLRRCSCTLQPCPRQEALDGNE